MTKQIEALKQALEALEDYEYGKETTAYLAKVERATAALRQALEQSVARIDTSTERVEKAAGNVHEQPDRQALQAAGIHPAPCARHCEANAFEIAARGMRKQITELQEALAKQPAPAQPLSDGWYVMQIDGGTKKIWPMTAQQALSVALHGLTKGEQK